jgi:hypothetical protein
MKTTVRQIAAYWEDLIDESETGIDWEDATTRCWRCASKVGKRLHRCHIIPKSLGGPDVPSNFVLLCGPCHQEAPNVDDPDFMWTWIKATSVLLYGTYWIDRAFAEFERIYGRKPFSELTEKQFDQVKSRISGLMDQTIDRFDGRPTNPATMAWVLAQVEKQTEAE